MDAEDVKKPGSHQQQSRCPLPSAYCALTVFHKNNFFFTVCILLMRWHSRHRGCADSALSSLHPDPSQTAPWPGALKPVCMEPTQCCDDGAEGGNESQLGTRHQVLPTAA